MWVDNVSGTLDAIKDSNEYYPKLSKFIKEINIPNGITRIEYHAFEGCTSLVNITIPNSVTSIGAYTFFGCTKLANITIPNSVTSIGDSTFVDCTSLKSITIPKSVTSIGSYAFSSCKNLANIYYKGTEEQWKAITKAEYWNRYMGDSVSGGTVIHYNS